MTEVDLDPDGLTPLLLVEAPTGVVYLHQCGGVACLQRRLEGFLVPLAGGDRAAAELTAMFHEGETCAFGQGGHGLPMDRWSRLALVVGGLSSWDSVSLDDARRGEAVEGLVPVTTVPHGPAWLLCANCD